MSTQEEIYEQQLLSGDNLPNNIYMQKPTQRQPQRQAQKSKFKNYQVLLKQSSKLNKKVIEFFKRNLVDLNRAGYVFEWISVNEDEVDFYAEQDIDKFPSLVTDDDTVIAGVSDITSTLKNFIKPTDNVPQNRRANNTAVKSNPESDIKDYMMNEINDGNDEDDENETQQTNMHKRAAEMMSKRSSMGLENPNGETASDPETHKQRNANNANNDHSDRNEVTQTDNLNATNLIKKTGVKDDDDMMEAFWGNLEESEY